MVKRVSVIFSVIAAVLHCSLAETISEHPAWKTLEEFECGESAADRIIGGLDAGLGQFPWIVRLGYTNEDEPELDWMCGGVLVTDQHVVTAAHCLTDADSGYELSFLRMGELNTDTDPDCQLQVCAPKVQDRKPKVIKPHPDFNNPAFYNDIAIISLDRPVELNGYVSPICLPRNDEELRVLPLGEMLTVAGWGKMNMTTEERAHILQYVQIPIQEKSACNLFGKAFKMGPSQICAGAIQNKDACGGDSGGPVMKKKRGQSYHFWPHQALHHFRFPLHPAIHYFVYMVFEVWRQECLGLQFLCYAGNMVVFDSEEGPKNYLIGVVSFGPTVCGIKKPGVYSSTVSYLKWILDNIMEM